ncbi:MAG: hypothetical protein EF811_03615 [Methanonatronarchaeia archaeon]|nr:MAG: hypothetical protein EF811_03615 [Methanonatronarchaeia archaeon]
MQFLQRLPKKEKPEKTGLRKLWRNRNPENIIRVRKGDEIMDLDILEENEREIKVSLIGQDHTIANLMKSIFLQDNRVEIASYNIDHPTLSDPILHVKVNEGEDLRETMNEILDQTIEEFRDLEEQFSETA